MYLKILYSLTSYSFWTFCISILGYHMLYETLESVWASRAMIQCVPVNMKLRICSGGENKGETPLFYRDIEVWLVMEALRAQTMLRMPPGRRAQPLIHLVILGLETYYHKGNNRLQGDTHSGVRVWANGECVACKVNMWLNATLDLYSCWVWSGWNESIRLEVSG